MKKITLVIFTAFLTLNCSKDDSFNEEQTNLALLASKKDTALKSEVNYEIVDDQSKSIGELSIYHDETTIYLICKSNDNITISEADLYFGTFSKIRKNIDDVETIPSYNFKTTSEQTENIYRIEKADLKFDKNGCIYMSTNFKFTAIDSDEIKSANCVSQILPGSEKLSYFLYCIN
ncbi:MAG: hypothetical protein CVU07_02120 [Bacteroidetes bacterium HGW-Bacteroidetes-23]|nr:MAG: hypothetical protein CVU07_02120 [Bacteroidetes bacterium HGW-Bacteroidetes-23]